MRFPPMNKWDAKRERGPASLESADLKRSIELFAVWWGRKLKVVAPNCGCFQDEGSISKIWAVKRAEDSTESSCVSASGETD